MDKTFLQIITLLLVGASFYAIWVQHRFFVAQNRKCQKYPYFKLRDKIILHIAESDDFEKHLDIYKAVNNIIEDLKFLSFKFYSEALTIALGRRLEEYYSNSNGCATKPKPDILVSDFEREFVNLLLKTAWDNSIPLRLAMTKFGYKLLVTSSLIRALKIFLGNHPELLKKKRAELKVMRDYSCISHFGLKCCS